MSVDTSTDARSGTDLAQQLIAGAGGTGAVASWASSLTGPGALLLSGSLVDGLGNARSDLDLYFVGGDRPGPGVQMALTATSYVDVERIESTALAELTARVEQVPADPWISRTSLSDLDRYYRLAIALPVLDGRPVPAEVAALDRESACRALAHWGDLHATANAARARLALGAGRAREAVCYAHESVVLMATSVLARAGDGYASAKWVDEKARRTLGSHTEAYAELNRLLTFAGPSADYVSTALAWVDRRSTRDGRATPPPALTGVAVIAAGPTGSAVVIGRSRYHAVVVEDAPAVRWVCDQDGEQRAAAEVELWRLSDRERGALLTVVVADLLEAGARESQEAVS